MAWRRSERQRRATLADGVSLLADEADLLEGASAKRRGGSREGTARPVFKVEADLEDLRIIFVADEAHLLDVRLLRHSEDLVDDLVTRR